MSTKLSFRAEIVDYSSFCILSLVVFYMVSGKKETKVFFGNIFYKTLAFLMYFDT